MNHTTALLAVGAMLFFYIRVARSARLTRGNGSPDLYFLSTHSHSKEEFGSAQVAYSLQMATVYPFFTFAFTGQWWLAAWNTLFYAIGIVLFIVVLPRARSGGVDLVGRSATLHALIASAHRAPALRFYASALSIVAFTGLALFETVWGTTVFKSLLGGNDFLYYVSIGVFAFYLIVVMWIGGQTASIRTAQYQLLIAYIGLHAVTAYLILQYPSTISDVSAPIVFAAIFVTGSIAALRRLRFWRQDGSWYMRTLNLVAGLSLLSVIGALAQSPGFFSGSTVKWAAIALPDNAVWMLFTLGCLPLFFQFVDLTNWQRLQSIAVSPETFTRDALQGLKFFLLESPLSWLFPIGLGLTAAITIKNEAGIDPWLSFLSYVEILPGWLGVFVSTATVVGIVCIFLSTADALLSAIGFAYAYDVQRSTSALTDRAHTAQDANVLTDEERRLVVRTGQTATSIAVVGAAGLYIILDATLSLGSNVIGFFLTFYAPMLSFAPSILIPVLTGRAAAPRVCLASMLTSSVAALAIGITSLISENPIWQWLGVPVCFVLSWFIYLAGFAIWRFTPVRVDQKQPDMV